MNNEVGLSWENFLNPDVTRPRLIAASVYITGFEILKESIIGRIRDFFTCGFNEKGDIIDPKYQTDVLSRNKNPVHASLDWLQHMKVIDQADIAVFDQVKRCRNALAHDLPRLLARNGLPDDFVDNFRAMVPLLRKIEVWWVMNVEIPTNPDFADKEVDESGILPGTVISFQLLCEIALGSDEQGRLYYEQFKKEADNRT